MNPEYIINSIKQISDIHYRNGETADRLAYRVGLLESKLREVCNFHEERIEFLQNEIKTLMAMVK
jgi:hypothetical protein